MRLFMMFLYEVSVRISSFPLAGEGIQAFYDSGRIADYDAIVRELPLYHGVRADNTVAPDAGAVRNHRAVVNLAIEADRYLLDFNGL